MIVVLLLMVATSILLAFRTPTFDFDEALYRRVAEEMKASHQYGTMTWDGHPFLEKPPTFVWMIVGCSRLIDGNSTAVSVIASRLPSLFFSTLTVLMLSLFWRRFGPLYATAFGSQSHPPVVLSGLLPPIAFGAALFPMVQVTSVLLDPMLTFFTTTALLVFCAAFLGRTTARLHLSPGQTALAAMAMTGAVAVKGLIGIVAPVVGLVAHELLSTLDEKSESRFASFWRRLFGSARGVAPAFLATIGLSIIVFAIFYWFAGPSFLYEFFIRQHFVRGARALQGHRGPVFYYALLLFIGGPAAALTCVSLGVRKQTRWPFARWGFPLSWCAGLLAFISLLATKLPNYTWPAWPAIALSLCILFVRNDGGPTGIAWLSRVCGWVGIVAAGLLAAFAVGLSFGVDAIARAAQSARAHTILSSLTPFPLTVRLGLILIGLAFAAQALLQRQFLRRVTGGATAVWKILIAVAALNCLVLLIVSSAVVPFMDQTIREPLVRIARLASNRYVPGDELTTVGLFSPTISSNYSGGRLTQVGTQPSAKDSLIAPVWRAQTCRQPAFSGTERDGYLLLCARSRDPAQSR